MDGALESVVWGAIAASSLVLGGLLALRLRISQLALGLIMAFGSGVLISAVAFELVEEAFETSDGSLGVALGLAAGALVFFVGDTLIDRMGGTERKRSVPAAAAVGSPLAIVLGIVLDGVPESAVIGLTILQGGAISAAFLAAVFISNLPEAIAATAGLRTMGWAGRKILGLWALVALVSALASLVGYVAFEGASTDVVAFVLCFAAGAILTMLADTMVPEAYEHGGKTVGLMTTLGFAVAFWLHVIEV